MRPRTLEEASQAYDPYQAGYPEFAFALNLGTWTVSIEPDGFQSSLIEPLTALSRGTQAVSVQRHDHADHGFSYAVDGTLITGFEPTWPNRRWGSQPAACMLDWFAGALNAAFWPEPHTAARATHSQCTCRRPAPRRRDRQHDGWTKPSGTRRPTSRALPTIPLETPLRIGSPTGLNGRDPTRSPPTASSPTST
ncbi:DUF6461 domain-containing protein [Spirillospora sp. CA-255316]